MKPWRTLATAKSGLSLRERDDEFVIYTGTQLLMTSRVHNSEREMAVLGCASVKAGSKRVRVLIGGLGMGFTLRACLDLLGADAEVVVCEISSAVVEWNRGTLAALAQSPLNDKRVRIEIEDVQQFIKRNRDAFDVVLLDVDNGTEALAQKRNRTLYQESGLLLLHACLRESGRVVFWSAIQDARFAKTLERAGFRTTVHSVAPMHSGNAMHTLFIGDVPAAQKGVPRLTRT